MKKHCYSEWYSESCIIFLQNVGFYVMGFKWFQNYLGNTQFLVETLTRTECKFQKVTYKD